MKTAKYLNAVWLTAADFRDEMLKQVKITNRLLAEQLKHQMSQIDLVALLVRSGLTARDVADVLGTTPATVAGALVRLRSKKLKKAGSRLGHERDAKQRERLEGELGNGLLRECGQPESDDERDRLGLPRFPPNRLVSE